MALGGEQAFVQMVQASTDVSPCASSDIAKSPVYRGSKRHPILAMRTFRRM